MKNIFKFLTISLFLVLVLNSFELITHAEIFQQPKIVKPEFLPGPTPDQVASQGSRSVLLDSFLPRLSVRIIGLIGALALISIVIGGLRYSTAYGNDDNLEKAKTQILYSVIAFLVAILSYTIVTVVTNIQFEGDTSAGPAQGPPAPQQNP